MSADPRAAAEALLAGNLVILPTETVYGLAGRADDPQAVARVYAVKGRPLDHPVIVHVADSDAALLTDAPCAWVRAVPSYASRLAEEFWPGPMTLVLPRAARAADHVTGGQDTVAVRVPGHVVAREILAAMDALEPSGAPHGVAAPSANRFGRVSPTTLAHALEELADDLGSGDLAVDGGECGVGVESTIIDCTGDVPRILRPGGVSTADIERVTGLVPREPGHGIRVPGALPSHYAPNAMLLLASDAESLDAYVDSSLEAGTPAASIGVIATADVDTPAAVQRLLAPRDSSDYARGLYGALRDADRRGLSLVIAVPPPEDAEGIGEAVCDRLRRAAAPRSH